MFKGSIVIKRNHLLNLIEDQKAAFRSKISDNAKHVVWGEQIAYETLLDEDFSRYDWDDYIQWLWPYATTKPYHVFDWLFTVVDEQ